MPSLRQVSEQVMRLVYGGDPGQDRNFDIREIELLVCEQVSAGLAVQAVDMRRLEGDYLPPNALVSFFPGVATRDPEEAEISCVDVLPDGLTLHSGSAVAWGQQQAAFWGTAGNVVWATASGAGFGTSGNFLAWATPDGVAWGTAGAGTELTVERSQTGDAFRVKLTGLSQLDYIEEICLAIESAAKRPFTTIVLAGGPTTSPGMFAASGIRSLEVTEDALCFDYYPVTSESFCAELPNGLDATQALLEAIPQGTVANYGTYSLINYRVCDVDPVRSSYVDLPVMPIALPHQMGIWRVYEAGSPDKDFIPVGIGQSGIAYSTASGLGDALGAMPGYEVRTRGVIRLNRYPAAVDIELLVYDPASQDPYAQLPVPPEMISEIIMKSAQAFAQARGLQDIQLDGPTATPGQNPQ